MTKHADARKVQLTGASPASTSLMVVLGGMLLLPGPGCSSSSNQPGNVGGQGGTGGTTTSDGTSSLEGGTTATVSSATGGVAPSGGSSGGNSSVASGGATPTGGKATATGGSTGGTLTGGNPSTGGITGSGGATVVTSTSSSGVGGNGGSSVSGGASGGRGASSSAGGGTARGGSPTGGSASAGSGPGAGGAAGAGSVAPVDCSTMPTPTTATRALCKPESGGIACHFGGDPGNYDVAFKLGGTAAGKTEVQAETKREMLAEVDTTAGQTELYSMKVNVREPQGQPDWSAASPGTPGLDLFFIGPSPQLDSIAYAPSVNPVVMYITGDSTVTDQDGPAIQAWGQRLPQYFGCGISVANYASSGGLTECNPCGTNYFSFYDDPKLWPAIKALLKANDIVLIEFGHNDKQTQQTPFETYLKKYVDETRAAGAFAVLVTPIVRSSYTGTPHINSVGVNLPESIRAVAAANNVPVIDLTARTQAYLIQRGNATGFYNDSAHTTLAGAQAYAELAADEIRTKNILPLRNYLRQP